MSIRLETSFAIKGHLTILEALRHGEKLLVHDDPRQHIISETQRKIIALFEGTSGSLESCDKDVHGESLLMGKIREVEILDDETLSVDPLIPNLKKTTLHGEEINNEKLSFSILPGNLDWRSSIVYVYKPPK